MAKHAYLSASASGRWLKCPPSARLCAQEEDKGSPFAQEGTDAHELCQYLVEKALGRDADDPTENLTWYSSEMQEAAEGYRDFILEQIREAEQHCPDPLVCIEQVLDYSKWVEHGFGTGDCVIIADDILHIIDMKYGTGVLVSAQGEEGFGNTQLMCYALGALDTFGSLYDIRRIRLTIYQPRRDNIDTFEMPAEKLLEWAEQVLAPTARLAYSGEGEFTPGNHCQFCKVKATCRKRAETNLETAKYHTAEAPALTPEEIAEILPRAEQLIKWAEDIRSYALRQAVNGTRYPGYKLVEGKSNRRYASDEAAAQIVLQAGLDPYIKEVAGITEMTRRLGRKRFAELLSPIIVKPRGKPVLVPESDPRPVFGAATSDFEEEKGE